MTLFDTAMDIAQASTCVCRVTAVTLARGQTYVNANVNVNIEFI